MAKKLSMEQKVFNLAVRGLARQGFKRCTQDGRCVLLNDSGERCALGWVVPRSALRVGERYTARIQRFWGARVVNDPVSSFLSKLGHVHDRSLTPGDMRSGLRGFAERHGLSTEGLPL